MIINIKVGITITFAFTSGNNSAVKATIDKNNTINTKIECVFNNNCWYYHSNIMIIFNINIFW